MLVPITVACVALAAQSFSLPPAALWTILDTEHGRVGECVSHPSGTHDCGPAQINAETWVPYFSRVLHQPIKSVFYDIRDNGCFNVNAAALILRINIDKAGGNIWEGMGRYNSATPSLKSAYQKRLIQAYKRLSE